MKVTADKLALTRTSLHVGVRIEGPDESWVRFALLKIPIEMLDVDLVQDLAIRVVQSHSVPVIPIEAPALF